MKNLKINLLALIFFCFFLSSCKVYRNLENLLPKVSKEESSGDFDINSLKKLVEGDQIILKTIDEKKHILFYKRIHGDKLMGTIKKNSMRQFEITENIEFAVTDINKIWVKRTSAVTTIPIVLIGAFGVILLILPPYFFW